MRDHNIESDTEDFFPSARNQVVPVAVAATPIRRLDLINLKDGGDVYLLSVDNPVNYLDENADFQVPSFAEFSAAARNIYVSKKTELVVYNGGVGDLILWLQRDSNLELTIIGGGTVTGFVAAQVLLASNEDNIIHWIYPDGSEEIGGCTLDVSELGSVVRLTHYFGNTGGQTTQGGAQESYYRIEILAGNLKSKYANKNNDVVVLGQLRDFVSLWKGAYTLTSSEIGLYTTSTSLLAPTDIYKAIAIESGIITVTKDPYIGVYTDVHITLDFNTVYEDTFFTFLGKGKNPNDPAALGNPVYLSNPGCDIILPDGTIIPMNSVADPRGADLSRVGSVNKFIFNGSAWVLLSNDPKFNYTPSGLSIVHGFTYIVKPSDTMILLSAGDKTNVTMPDVATSTGRVILFKCAKIYSVGELSLNNAPINIISLNGVLQNQIPANMVGQWCELVSDGSVWLVLKQGT